MFHILDELEFFYQGNAPIMKPMQCNPSLHIISAMSVRKGLRKGCWAYLAYVVDIQKEVKLDDIPIVREFFDVFPNELPEVPPIKRLISKLMSYRELDQTLCLLIGWPLQIYEN